MFLGAIVLLGNAKCFSQIIWFRLHFAVILVLFTLLGIAIGYVRTFRGLAILARFSVFGVIAVIIIVMVSTKNIYPYFWRRAPIRTELVRGDVDFQAQPVATMNMVNAYSGRYICTPD
jgi:hypothetical protein